MKGADHPQRMASAAFILGFTACIQPFLLMRQPTTITPRAAKAFGVILGVIGAILGGAVLAYGSGVRDRYAVGEAGLGLAFSLVACVAWFLYLHA